METIAFYLASIYFGIQLASTAVAVLLLAGLLYAIDKTMREDIKPCQ